MTVTAHALPAERGINWHPDRRSTTYNRRGGRNVPGRGARKNDPGSGDRTERFFFIHIDAQKAAGEGHEDGKDLCEAAGDLFRVPEPCKLPRDPGAERYGHGD